MTKRATQRSIDSILSVLPEVWRLQAVDAESTSESVIGLKMARHVDTAVFCVIADFLFASS